MSTRPAPLKTEQFDMDSFFDFNQSTTQSTPVAASASTPRPANQDWNGMSPFDKPEERQQFNGPSHDYNLYKQQVGLPVGSLANLPPQSMLDGYNSGMGDMGYGWSSGIDMDADMQMDFNSPHSAMPPMFFPTPNGNGQSDAFVDPNSIGGHEEPASNVGRLWPGMHSQQAQAAAMQKAAQASAVQQRQLKLQAQHAQYRHPSNASQTQAPSQSGHAHSRRPSHVNEPHVEESISRLLNQMRQNSSAGDNDDEDSANDMLPHIARMKKDEEEMDDDERLLASEEGKKLSSKERRQLRNKVSARAFRSRRKEYISQLEGEVAIKAQENNNLRSENSALMQENDRYRTLIETLLRHPAFTPFINDISKDPSVLGGHPQQQQQQPQQQQQAPQQQQQQQQQAPAQSAPQQQQQQQPPQDSKPDFMNFDASQLQIPGQQQQQQQQQQAERIGLAMIPENDFSKLNINGFNAMNYNNNSYSVNAYPVLEVPAGPDPADLLFDRLPASTSSSSAAAPADNDTLDVDDMFAKLDGAARNLRWALAGEC